jgi:hypothetical protein
MSVYHRGRPEDILQMIPTFRFARPVEFGFGANENMELVLKNPAEDSGSMPTPVGLVSNT